MPAGGGGGGAVVQATTLTGVQNDFVLTAGCTELRCNNAALLTITGFAAGTDGQRVVVFANLGQVDITDQAAGSVAANRVVNGVTGPRSLVGALGRLTMSYSATLAKWIVQAHEQGDWIQTAYSAANFTAFGGMVWTVDAGDVIETRYYLRGRELHVDLMITTSTINIGGGASQSIRVGIGALGNYPLASNPNHFYPLLAQDNGTWKQGYMNHDNTGLYFQPTMVGTSWLASANLTGVQWSGILGVT